MNIRKKIKELYKTKMVINNKDIIQKEIDNDKKDLSINNKNVNQRNYYKKHKDYYINKAIKIYSKDKDKINKRRRALYKKRLENNNVNIISYDKNKLLIKCKQFAKEKGGKCLSDNYIIRTTKMKWQCSKGHIWEAIPHHIINRKQWCPKCAGVKANENRKLDWKEIIKLAKKHDGKLLSEKKEYINTDSKLKWKCKHGHVWRASIGSIKYQESWCPYCNDNFHETFTRFLFEEFTGEKFVKAHPEWLINNKTKRLLELDGYNKELKIAFEYNGVQHYEEHVFFHNNLDNTLKAQRCRDGLKQELCKQNGVSLCVIKNNLSRKEIKKVVRDWLNKHNIFIVKEPVLKDFKSFKYTKQEVFRNFVESIGYELLDEYVGVNKKVKIKCDKGHIWEVQPRAVKNGNRCPFCSKRVKYTIEQIIEESEKLGLKCLEDAYINNIICMRFKCDICGKKVLRTSTQILNGVGCCKK